MFEVGDKVRIPKTKSIGVFITDCLVVRSTKALDLDHLYIIGIKDDGLTFVLNTAATLDVDYVSGGYYLKEDLVLYNPEDHYIGGVVDV